MKLAASKVDLRTGCEVGVRVVLVGPDVAGVVVVEAVEEGGRVVVLAVELVGNGVAVGTEQNSVLFTTRQSLTVELREQ